MLRPRYSQVKFYEDMKKALAPAKVEPIKYARPTSIGSGAEVAASVGGELLDAILAKQKKDAEAADIKAAGAMLDKFYAPQEEWNEEEYGSTPDTLRAATMPGALAADVGSQEMPIESYGAMGPDGMPAALGAPNAALGAPIDIEQPYAAGTDEEDDDANWMSAPEHAEFYKRAAAEAQTEFDAENVPGLPAVMKANRGGAYNTANGVKGPRSNAMLAALRGEGRALEMEEAERDRTLTAANLKYQRDLAAATLAHTRGMEVKRMERGLKLEDKLGEINERNRLATKRDETNRKHRAYLAAIKPYQSLGVPIPEHIIRPFQEAPRAAPSMISPPQDSTTASAAESVAAPAPNVPQNAPTGSPRASSGTSLMEAQANAAGKKAGAIELAKLKAKAKAAYPMVEHNSKFLLNALDAIVAPKLDKDNKPLIVDGKYLPGKEHAGLENFVGFRSPFGGAALMNLPFGPEKPIGGSNAADFEAKLGQVQGKLFLQAFETLKGGGQITEVEGEKATAALANLSASQSEEQFRAALLEFRYEVGELVKLARKRAGMDETPTQNEGGWSIVERQ